MKVVVVGATGFVGSAILKYILDSPGEHDIEHVFTLTRNPLPHEYSDHSRLTSIIHTDFLSYPQALLERLGKEGIQACLWCIGGRHTQLSRWSTDEEYIKCSVDFTIKAAEAFRRMWTEHGDDAKGKVFRFVFCSGHATELDQDKTLWVMGKTRKVKGMAENALFQIANDSNGEFEAYTARPCGIYQPQPSVTDWLLTTFALPSCHVEELAAVMVDVAKNGGSERIITHQMIRDQGARLLNQSTLTVKGI